MADQISLPRSVVEQALRALEKADRINGFRNNWIEVNSLIAALEQPQGEQEPAAYRHMHEDGWEYYDAPTGSDCNECQPLYTHPQNLNCKSTQARLATLWGYEKPQPIRQPRTEQEIVDQTEKLAELFMNLFQQRVKKDPSTTLRDSKDVRAQFCWHVACRVQNMLTDTDPENAAAELEHGIGGEA